MSTPVTVANPVDEEQVYRIESHAEQNFSGVLQDARTNSEYLRRLSVRDRLNLCLRVQQYIAEHREAIISKIVEETGKARLDAFNSEIYGVLELISYYDKHAEQILRDEIVPTPLRLMGKKSKLLYEPLGVVLVISSWSRPFYQTLVPCLSAFIAGNAVICKPSEMASLQGLIEEILQRNGLTRKAIQVVYGGAEAGEALIAQRPDKIVFSGSAETGREIMRQASEHLIPVDLELNGKDAMIVFDDANLEKATAGALWGGLANGGQSRSSIERIYIQEGVYRPFMELLKKKATRLVAASSGTDVNWSQIDIGPLTTPSQAGKIRRNVIQAVATGARIQHGGATESATEYPPTILTAVDPAMRIMREPTPGPVLAVSKFSSEQEVIRLANDSDYGLSASVWTKNLRRAEQVARQLRTGSVCINNVKLAEANPALPYGGTKQSGMGRRNGVVGLRSFCNLKSVVVEKSNHRAETFWFPYTREKYELFSRLVGSLFSGTRSFMQFILTRWRLERLVEKQEL